MRVKEEALALHKSNKGKLEVNSKVEINNEYDLSLAYTPGVAEPCKLIHENNDLVYTYTNKGNMVAVVTDGSAVLGLGNIGSEASIPVMEGKALLFKKFAGIDAFPICVKSQDIEDIIFTVKQIEPIFGGINLEDIAAPKCFEIERRLSSEMNIPIFHDDQHGTAIVVLAAALNAIKLVNKSIKDAKIVINGAGAAGIAIGKILYESGARNIIQCNRKGIIEKDNNDLDIYRKDFISKINPLKITGSLSDAIEGADMFIGVSSAGTLTKEMVSKMSEDSIVFAMANPVPEIWPNDAKAGGARIIGTGRSDYPNQVNNVLAFPGIFRGALDVRASIINQEMKIAAAIALASMVTEDQLNEEHILPNLFDERTAEIIAKAVSEAAIRSGVAVLNR